MWFKKRRDRRIAEARGQLTELDAGQPPTREPAQAIVHLVSAGTWLFMLQLRRAAPTRSDYLFAPFFRRKSSRQIHREPRHS